MCKVVILSWRRSGLLEGLISTACGIPNIASAPFGTIWDVLIVSSDVKKSLGMNILYFGRFEELNEMIRNWCQLDVI